MRDEGRTVVQCLGPIRQPESGPVRIALHDGPTVMMYRENSTESTSAKTSTSAATVTTRWLRRGRASRLVWLDAFGASMSTVNNMTCAVESSSAMRYTDMMSVSLSVSLSVCLSVCLFVSYWFTSQHCKKKPMFFACICVPVTFCKGHCSNVSALHLSKSSSLLLCCDAESPWSVTNVCSDSSGTRPFVWR